MTDQELAQEVASRLWAAEAAAEAVLNDATATRPAKTAARRRLAQLKRAHLFMEKAQRLLLASGDMVQPLSGGQKPPPSA